MTETSFKGKVVVVTGAARGIGHAVARAFAESGATVQSWDIDPIGMAGLLAVQCDVGLPDDIARAASGLDRVDVLVNNAGIGSPKGLFELEVDDWDRVLNVNLRSIWLCTKYLAPKMPPGSAIVNIASTRALMSEPNTEPYSASKGGVLALTHSLAVTLAERRIRVNCVSPGWIETGDYDLLSSKAHDQHLVGRVGRPEDIARAVLFLASDASGFTTGSNLVIDGGMTRKMIYEE